ncbi:SPCC736.13 [Symbiodinium natans]|uniref:SPCC736.13 protein n=1 Tax=Symbiodinium natans TaxID=878477 RepID=A0A812R6E9_9DINO|nr:SPCC736.13 [Symbiodinium natans]
MLSSKLLSGQNTAVPVAPGDTVSWVLANDGAVPWPAGTTLRLVSGPVLANPVLEVPSAQPGQTVELSMEVTNDQDQVLEANYCLVTPCGKPFGELLGFSVGKKESPQSPPPLCGILAAPDDSMEALQGEVKALTWTLANVGQADWPADACCRLFYNTPGFEHLPADIPIPGMKPGFTVDLEVQALMPEKEGCFRAMWAVTSPSVPDFGEVLAAEFHVSDFPFMDWMLAETESFSIISEEAKSEAPDAPAEAEVAPEAPSVLSAGYVMHEHLFGNAEVSYPERLERSGLVSLGSVALKAAPWVVRLLVQNQSTLPWPEDCSLQCCLGSGFGCASLPLGSVEPGEVIQICMELEAAQGRSAWVLGSGGICFGPVFVVEAN